MSGTDDGRTDGPLRVTPIGVGTAYSASGVDQACFLVEAGEFRAVFDLGGGSLNRLQSVIDPASIDLIAISHLHPDHCVDLFSLQVYLAWGPGRGTRIPVFGPAGLRDRLTAFVDVDDGWEVFDFQGLSTGGGVREPAPGVFLSWRTVPHLDPTFALRIDCRGRSFCYGADCGPNETLVEFAQGVDLLIAECSFGTDPIPDGVPHLNAAAVADLARRSGAARVLLTHCYPEFDAVAAAEIVRRSGVPAEVARSGEAVTP